MALRKEIRYLTMAFAILFHQSEVLMVKIGIINDKMMNPDKRIKKMFDEIVRKHDELINPVLHFEEPGSNSDVMLQKFKKVKCIIDFSRSNEKANQLGEMLQIPVITSGPNSAPIGKFTVSMYPDYELINRVIVQTLKAWKLSPVALVYDVKRSVQAANLQSLAKKAGVRMILMPEISMDDKRSLEYAAGELKRSHLTSGVLLCDPRDIYKILDQTIDFKLYDEEKWQWFASDLDYKPKCASTLNGIVGFNLISPENTAANRTQFASSLLSPDGRVYSQFSDYYYASLHDAIILLIETHPSTISLDTLRNVRVQHCNGPKDTNTPCSFTGDIEFVNGTRKVTEMKVVAIKKGADGGFESNGEWSRKNKLGTLFRPNSKRFVTKNNVPCDDKNKNRRKNTYKILVKKGDDPFVIINENASLTEQKFTGFCIDIVRELAKERNMNFNYTFEILDTTGKWDVNSSKWTGIIGQLIADQNAHMGTGSLTITAGRERAIDFSKPFMDFTMAVILRKPEAEKPNMFRFLDPFSPVVWLCTVLAVFAMTIFMYTVDYLSPYGYRKTAKESGEPGDEFSLYNSLWFATASMLQQGGDNTPKSPSGRLLAASFWFFVLLMISTYTANLAAYFTNKKPKQSINSLADLAKQDEIKYGVYKNGQIHSFLERSNDSDHKKMVRHVTTYDTFMASAKEAVNKARREKFAYLTETPILEYYNNKNPCNTMLVRNLLETKSYGFALPKNSDLTTNLSVNILKLRETGFINSRYIYWWETMSQCPDTKKTKEVTSMTIQFNSMAGVFIVLVSGVIISFILLLVEVKFKWVVDLILEAGCEQCTDYYCEEDESYEYMEQVDAVSTSQMKRVPEAYSNAQESKV